MMTSSCLKLNNLSYLLVNDSCTIFILFLCFLAGSVAQTRVLFRTTPLIDRGEDHVAHLIDRRLQLWQEGKLEDLLHEGRAIQKRQFRSGARHNNVNWVKSFSLFMFEGKVRMTLRLLNRAGGLSGQPLSLSDMVCDKDPSLGTVHEALMRKHPAPGPVSPQSICFASFHSSTRS